MKAITPLLVLLSIAFCAHASEEDELAEMQKQLNQEVMSNPFSVAQIAEIDAYVKDAMKKDIKPVSKAPKYWRRGYTCENTYRYGWRAYRDCVYHYRYYGRYWY